MSKPRSQPPMNTEAKNSPQPKDASDPLPPRLLNLVRTASYMGVSQWTVRDLEAAGILPRVRVPLPNNGELRKILFDRKDLDRLIEIWKDRFPSNK